MTKVHGPFDLSVPRGTNLVPTPYWTTQEKWLIVEEAQLPENAVAEVARRRGVNNNQVFSWIRAAKAGKLGPRPSILPPLPAEPEPSLQETFIPIGMFGEGADSGPSLMVPVTSPAPISPASDEPRPVRRTTRTIRTTTLDERPGVIEIDLPCGTRVRVDAFVNQNALRRVLAAIEELP